MWPVKYLQQVWNCRRFIGPFLSLSLSLSLLLRSDANATHVADFLPLTFIASNGFFYFFKFYFLFSSASLSLEICFADNNWSDPLQLNTYFYIMLSSWVSIGYLIDRSSIFF